MKIAFTYPKKFNPISWLIRKFTKSKWSHCFIVLDDDLVGDPLIIEANMYGGIKLNLLSEYKESHHIEIYDILATDYTVDYIKTYIGDVYGYLQLPGYIIMKLLHLRRNPITLDMVCSEICTKFLKQGSLANEFKGLEINSATEEDLYDIIRESSNFKLTYAEEETL